MLGGLRGTPMTVESLAGLSAWRMDWFWGLPLLMGTLLFHLAALRWLERAVVRPTTARSSRGSTSSFAASSRAWSCWP
jgi:hypothetical protein